MRLIDADRIPWKSYPNDYGESYDDYAEKCDIDKMQAVDAVPIDELMIRRDQLCEADRITLNGLWQLNSLIVRHKSSVL